VLENIAFSESHIRSVCPAFDKLPRMHVVVRTHSPKRTATVNKESAAKPSKLMAGLAYAAHYRFSCFRNVTRSLQCEYEAPVSKYFCRVRVYEGKQGQGSSHNMNLPYPSESFRRARYLTLDGREVVYSYQ
jgi:hypothetical protein